jgi:hypothetical protein
MPVDSRVWTGAPEPDLTGWLGAAPHSFDGDQLVLHTPDGDIQPRPGSSLIQWTDAEITVASRRSAQRVYGPDGIAERLRTGRTVAAHWHQTALDRGWTETAHALGCVLAALAGETDPRQLGLDHPDQPKD